MPCAYCRMSGGKEELRACPLCYRRLCLYHRDPKAHGCEGVDWVNAKPEKELLTPGNILKAAAGVLGLIILWRIMLAVYGVLAGLFERCWRFFKAQALVMSGVPLALGFLMILFPGSAALLGIDDLSGRMKDIRLEAPAAPQPSPLPMFSGLSGCSLAMTYSSTLERKSGDKCDSLCRERNHTGHIIRSMGSDDCYCC